MAVQSRTTLAGRIDFLDDPPTCTENHRSNTVSFRLHGMFIQLTVHKIAVVLTDPPHIWSISLDTGESQDCFFFDRQNAVMCIYVPKMETI